ncbi:unnamed protein product, partial [marine sediment metagenome]
MKSYKYVARDSDGKQKKGLVQAASSTDVLSYLEKEGFTPISVNEMASNVSKKKRVIRRKRIKSADIAALCWQLATMIEGGIPITIALDTIAEDAENSSLDPILQGISEKVKKGESFSDGMAEFPKVFNKLSCALILAGETGGNLGDALTKLAQYFDSRDRLAKKIKGATAYPIFVMCFITLIVIFIMAFIVPRFKTIFDSLGGELPAFTRAFMAFYDILRYNIIYII